MIYFDRPELCGLLPMFADESDPRPLIEQINIAYAHGGGWREIYGFKLKQRPSDDRFELHYPGDPPFREVARGRFRDQTIVLFQAALVAVIESDGSFAVSRMD